MPSAIPAYPCTISVGNAPVAFSNEATVRTGTGVYQLASTYERLDPGTTVTVEVDSAPASGFKLDYLRGIVTFDTDPGSSAVVTVSGKYIPVTPLANAQSVDLTLTSDLVELATFSTDGYKHRASTLQDFSATVSGLDRVDSALGDTSLYAKLTSGDPLLLDVDEGANGDKFRAWVKVSEADSQLNPEQLLSSSVKLVGHAFKADDGEWVAWGFPT